MPKLNKKKDVNARLVPLYEFLLLFSSFVWRDKKKTQNPQFFYSFFVITKLLPQERRSEVIYDDGGANWVKNK